MSVIEVVGIVLFVVMLVIVLVVLPALAVVRSRPERQRMMKASESPGDPPLDYLRAFVSWLEKNDRRRTAERRDQRAADNPSAKESGDA